MRAVLITSCNCVRETEVPRFMQTLEIMLGPVMRKAGVVPSPIRTFVFDRYDSGSLIYREGETREV